MNTEELIKKQTTWIKAIFGCVAGLTAVILIIAAILVPKIYKAADSVEHSLTEINVLVEDADEAVQHINNVDFDHLNQAINDLSAITNKLANIIAPNK